MNEEHLVINIPNEFHRENRDENTVSNSLLMLRILDSHLFSKVVHEVTDSEMTLIVLGRVEGDS